jgi:hypothetical protein
MIQKAPLKAEYQQVRGARHTCLHQLATLIGSEAEKFRSGAHSLSISSGRDIALRPM